MPMLKALTVMKRQWFAMEAKIEIPCGEKKKESSAGKGHEKQGDDRKGCGHR